MSNERYNPFTEVARKRNHRDYMRRWRAKHPYTEAAKRGTKWSPEELEAVRAYYSNHNNSTFSTIELARAIGRSVSGVLHQAWNMRLGNVHRSRRQGSWAKNSNWKGDAAKDISKRDRARRWFSLPCERCGKPGVDRHHKDGDPGNNQKDNVMSACRKCHMILDGRLELLRALNRT